MNTELSRWNGSPFSVMRDLEKEISNLFDDAWSARSYRTSYAPAVDVEETSDHYVMSLDMPGMKKEDINIELTENQITISGERQSAHKENTDSARYQERTYGKFSRSFSLPQTVDSSKVEATYENGVLMLALPKAEASKPRKVEIADGKNGFFQRLIGEKKEKNVKIA